MHDEIRSAQVARPCPRERYVGFNKRETRIALRLLEIITRAGCEIVDADDSVAIGDEPRNEVGAKKAGGSSYEHEHVEAIIGATLKIPSSWRKSARNDSANGCR